MSLWPDEVLAKTVKAELRKRTKALRAQMTAEQHRADSDAVCALVSKLDVFLHARSVGLYVPHVQYREVDVMPLMRACLARGAAVGLPRWPGDLSMMEFGVAADEQDFDVEPRGWGMARQTAPLLEPDLVIVPGLLFDEHGRRIGYGAGLYDRYLSGRKDGVATLGVCFEFQLAIDLPHGPHDAHVSQIVTDRRVLQRRE